MRRVHRDAQPRGVDRVERPAGDATYVVVEVLVPAGSACDLIGAVADRGELLRTGEVGKRARAGKPRRRDPLDCFVEDGDGDVVRIALRPVVRRVRVPGAA